MLATFSCKILMKKKQLWELNEDSNEEGSYFCYYAQAHDMDWQKEQGWIVEIHQGGTKYSGQTTRDQLQHMSG